MYIVGHDPPGTPAFSSHQKPQNSSVNIFTNAVSEMTKNIASNSAKPDVQPSNVTPPVVTSFSPEKVANLRASCLQNIRDLYQLFDCGAIMKSEYVEQKKT